MVRRIAFLIVLAFHLAAHHPASAATLNEAGFEEVTFVTGLTNPSSIVFDPDGNLFITEQAGPIRVTNASGTMQSTPFLTLSADSSGERGVLGLAFDPNYRTNGFVYVYYTKRSNLRNTLSRFTRNSTNPITANPASEVVLLDVAASTEGYHNGGAAHFGTDGMLYVAIGEGHNSANAQNLSNLEGKLLRINPANPANVIPADNPFVGTAGARGEIWAYGLRNPFTFDVDPTNGAINVNDVGNSSWEEVNRIAKGGNFGWPTCEGNCNPPRSGLINPIHAYDHTNNQRAITGGVFYRGSQFPAAFNGAYFFQDWIAGWLKRLNPDNSVTTFATGLNQPVDLKVDTAGALYYLERTGRVKKVSYIGGGNRTPTARITASPVSGVPPLAVSFSGSTSSDPDGDSLSFTWNFGDGSPTATGVTANHTYAAAGAYTAQLTVNDGRGGTASASIGISLGTPPVATLSTPATGTMYSGGDTISYSGTATDAQDGTLPASAFSWVIAFHHETHFHDFVGPVAGQRSGSITIPRVGETSDNVWYRITLTVTDSTGLTHSVSRDVLPRKATMTLATQPTGLEVMIDGQPRTAPSSIVGVVGVTRSIGVASPQTLGGTTYEFVDWSDAGSQTHSLNTPAASTNYTARFRESTAPREPGNLRLTP